MLSAPLVSGIPKLKVVLKKTQLILTSILQIPPTLIQDGVGEMKKVIAGVGAFSLGLVLAGAASAASFEDSMARCLSKNANTRDQAMVTLDCTAEGGKLSSCKVLSDSAPGKGFDKAALCVAEALPIGSRTGQVKVPVRFPGS